jgi:hypothetical protein
MNPNAIIALNLCPFFAVLTWCDELVTNLWDTYPLLTKEM